MNAELGAPGGGRVGVRRFAFPKTHHLRSPREFEAVYAAKTRENRGPLVVHARPNELCHPRLGMSVSRKVGIAVRRNRIRRRLREAFRLMRHDLPAGYDFVVVARPHEPLLLADYQRLLSAAVVRLHNVWRGRRASGAPQERERSVPPGAAGDATGSRSGGSSGRN